jgi:hypothetical protein
MIVAVAAVVVLIAASVLSRRPASPPSPRSQGMFAFASRAPRPAIHRTPKATPRPVATEKPGPSAESLELIALRKAAEMFNDKMGVRAFSRSSIVDGGKTAILTVDADYWDPLSSQDKNLMFQTFLNVWGHAYALRHDGEAGGAALRFSDLAGNELKWDVISQ